MLILKGRSALVHFQLFQARAGDEELGIQGWWAFLHPVKGGKANSPHCSWTPGCPSSYSNEYSYAHSPAVTAGKLQIFLGRGEGVEAGHFWPGGHAAPRLAQSTANAVSVNKGSLSHQAIMLQPPWQQALRKLRMEAVCSAHPAVSHCSHSWWCTPRTLRRRSAGYRPQIAEVPIKGTTPVSPDFASSHA